MEIWRSGYIGFLGFLGLLGFVINPSFFSLFSLFSLFALFQSKPQPLDFLMQKIKIPAENPNESNWAIGIFRPNRTIERCIVLCDSVRCPWWVRGGEPYFEKTIYVGGKGIVKLPKGSDKEDAEIIIKDGKKTLKKVKFKDIIVHRAM